MIRKILGDLGVYGISPFISKIASVFILPLVTPYLTKTDYGIFGIVTAYHTFMSLFYMLGLQVNLSNSFYKSRHQFKWLWRQLYGFLILWSILYVTLLAIVIFFTMPSEAINNRYTIILIYTIPTLVFGPVSQFASLFYQFNRKVKETAIRNVFFGLLSAFLVLYFIKYLRLGYMGWMWTYFITTILTNFSWFIPYNFKYRLFPIFNFKVKTIQKAVRVGLPIVPHLNALYLLNQSDRIVMDFQKISPAQIGLYNVAYTTANLFETFGQAFTKTLNPFVNKLINQKKEKDLRDIFFASQITFYILLLLFSCIAKEVFQFLIRNDELNDVYQLGVLIAMSTMFKPMYMAANSKLFYYEKTKAISIYSFLAGIVNVGLNFLLIPIWGIQAAAFSTFLGYLFLTYSRFWSRDYKKISTINYYPAYWMILSIFVCLIGCYICVQYLFVRISISVIILIISFGVLIKFQNILKLK